MQENHRQECVTLILQVLQRKKVTNKFQQSSQKQLIRKRNTLNVCSEFLEGGMVEITASYPAGVIGNTLENLRAAAAGEHEEWSLDYPHFADVAEQEGFPMIAAMYRNISIAEKGHEERYLAFMNNIENMTVFAKEGEVVWQCRNCGYIEIGKEAPEVCPACLHPQAYFEVKKENY